MGYAPIRMETRAGKSAHFTGRKITPFSQAFMVGLPGLPGGLIWNRPVSVLVQESDGSEYVIPVIDHTRRAELALLGAVAGFTIFFVIYQALFVRKSSGGKS